MEVYNADLRKRLQFMDIVFKKAVLNDAAKFGLLMQEVMNILELDQLQMYRGAGTI